VDTLKTLTVTQNSLLVRTPMGVPLTLNISAATVLKIQGFVKANSLPQLSDFLLRRPFLSSKIEIISDIKPRYDIRSGDSPGIRPLKQVAGYTT